MKVDDKLFIEDLGMVFENIPKSLVEVYEKGTLEAYMTPENCLSQSKSVSNEEPKNMIKKKFLNSFSVSLNRFECSTKNGRSLKSNEVELVDGIQTLSEVVKRTSESLHALTSVTSNSEIDSDRNSIWEDSNFYLFKLQNILHDLNTKIIVGEYEKILREEREKNQILEEKDAFYEEEIKTLKDQNAANLKKISVLDHQNKELSRGISQLTGKHVSCATSFEKITVSDHENEEQSDHSEPIMIGNSSESASIPLTKSDSEVSSLGILSQFDDKFIYEMLKNKIDLVKSKGETIDQRNLDILNKFEEFLKKNGNLEED